jgi:diadenosine tetraphosphate (Ap4A) HIT family hydrolase
MSKKCLTCSKCLFNEQGILKSLISDLKGSVFSLANHRPNSKAHANIITKKHTEDLRVMIPQEWADILPVLKETIKKIDKVYRPLGYRISIPVGEKAGQNVPYHFYMRIVPKYKKDWGTVSTSVEYKPVPPEKIKMLEENLQPNQDKVIAEKSKVVARLHNETALGYTIISTKQHLPSGIFDIDAETWTQIGEILKDCMRKFESSDIAHDFNVSFSLGEAGKIFESEKENKPYTSSDGSEIKIVLFPKLVMGRWWRPDESRPIKKGQRAGTMEDERIGQKIRDPEKYAQEWGKKSTPSIRGHEESTTSQIKSLSTETSPRESIWKQPVLYWGLGGGLLIAGLGLGIYWLFSKKNKEKSKSK